MSGLIPVMGRTAEESKPPELKTINIDKIPYVNFESFCKLYQFNPKDGRTDKAFTLKGPYGEIIMLANSRRARFNGLVFWLSFPVRKTKDNKLAISKLDVFKTFDPLLRRNEVLQRNTIRGVILDAGHGGHDKGAVGSDTAFEKDMALDVVLKINKLLKKLGVKTKLTRKSDYFVTLKDRAKMANKYKDHIFVSMHFNAARNKKAQGVEIFAMTPQYSGSTGTRGLRKTDFKAHPGNTYDEANVLLAEMIHRPMAKWFPKEKDRGIKRARFSVLRNTRIPAVLIEGGFMSNAEELKRIEQEDFRDKLAQAITAGISNYIGFMNNKKPSPLPRQPKIKFRAPKNDVALRPMEIPKGDKPMIETSPNIDNLKPEELQPGRDYEYDEKPPAKPEAGPVIERDPRIYIR